VNVEKSEAMKYIDGYSRRIAAAALVAVTGGCLIAVPVRGAALWESPTWGLSASGAATWGYDSNLVARSENLAASYVSAAPSMRLARRASLTRLDLTGTIEGTTFLGGDVSGSIDPSLHLVMAYPWDEFGNPLHELDARWIRHDVTDTDLGRRVRAEEWRLGARSILFDTGKTRFGAGLAADAVSFQSDELHANEGVLADVDVAYAVTSDAHLGIGYGHGWGRSDAPAGGQDVTRSQNQVVIRGRGRLLPKVTGTVDAGYAMIDYRGGIARSEGTWIAGVVLDWDVAAGTQATMRARRFADFAPQGESVMRTGVEVEVSRGLAHGWRVRAGGGASSVERTVPSGLSESTAFTTLAGLGYQLTERFSAGISHRFTRQYAEQAAYDYTRHQVEARVDIHF